MKTISILTTTKNSYKLNSLHNSMSVSSCVKQSSFKFYYYKKNIQLNLGFGFYFQIVPVCGLKIFHQRLKYFVKICRRFSLIFRVFPHYRSFMMYTSMFFISENPAITVVILFFPVLPAILYWYIHFRSFCFLLSQMNRTNRDWMTLQFMRFLTESIQAPPILFTVPSRVEFISSLFFNQKLLSKFNFLISRLHISHYYSVMRLLISFISCALLWRQCLIIFTKLQTSYWYTTHSPKTKIITVRST